jgi:hypothetical protein
MVIVTIMLFKILGALRIKENIHKPVCKHARVYWNHVGKIAGRLLIIIIITKSLEAFVF